MTICWMPAPLIASDAAFVEQARFTSEQVARAFGVPAWLIDPSIEVPASELRRRAKSVRRARYYRAYRNRGRR